MLHNCPNLEDLTVSYSQRRGGRLSEPYRGRPSAMRARAPAPLALPDRPLLLAAKPAGPCHRELLVCACESTSSAPRSLPQRRRRHARAPARFPPAPARAAE
ncbi:hypothetical protein PsYK624_154760 [Phanerochaete sordida]|uniref:Uncharacterized protein n=1 Tax=Phanerochaete sordida TaxID=48140 RepID=A0A9P3GQX9_9APHY|nr:hypothetical protein PsYK624_154760 [Phanerochaete sordida]